MNQTERQLLADKIKRAFSDTPPPTNGSAGYELGEFDGKHWQDITPAMIRKRADELSHFSPEGFRYYLPAILIAVILNPKEIDVAVDNIINRLSPPTSDGRRKIHFQNQTSVISKSEKEAIAEFLNAYKKLEPGGAWTVDDKFKRTLERAVTYWNEAK